MPLRHSFIYAFYLLTYGSFLRRSDWCHAFGLWQIATNKLQTVSTRSYLAYIGIWFYSLVGQW
jgi:hypothetical protein